MDFESFPLPGEGEFGGEGSLEPVTKGGEGGVGWEGEGKPARGGVVCPMPSYFTPNIGNEAAAGLLPVKELDKELSLSPLPHQLPELLPLIKKKNLCAAFTAVFSCGELLSSNLIKNYLL